jgi:hypothetical protein
LKDQEKRKFWRIRLKRARSEGWYHRGGKQVHCTSLPLSPSDYKVYRKCYSHTWIGTTVLSRNSDIQVYKRPWVYTLFSLEAITNLMHKYLSSYNIIILDMFRAILCSSTGGQIVYVQHLVPSLSMSGRWTD